VVAFLIPIQDVLSSTPSSDWKFNITTLPIDVQHGMDMPSFPPPLDEHVNESQ
jgi:hypothetical protein